MNITPLRPWLIPVLLTLTASPLQAAQPDGEAIVKQGNGKGATACIACHGADGLGNPGAGYPYLAGLPQAYLVSQLQAFANRSRQNPIMKPIAGSLSDAEINAVANYFSALDNPILASAQTAQADSSQGARLAYTGKWEAGVPGCFRCHGPKGEGVAPHFPPLVGQPARYIRDQLSAWQKGQRSNDPMGLMRSVVDGLSDAEVRAVADFLAAQAKKPEQFR